MMAISSGLKYYLEQGRRFTKITRKAQEFPRKFQNLQSLSLRSCNRQIAVGGVGGGATLWWICLQVVRNSSDAAVRSCCPHQGEWFGDKATFELFLLLLEPNRPIGSPGWTWMQLFLWPAVGSPSG